ncbi:GCN5-related N-acetyltransferase [Candidatus Magnetomorum sp. HK-1]|nr:GCN5-related N-acetyltransferase [Candidatus Magnetomorum sp. HK-1]
MNPKIHYRPMCIQDIPEVSSLHMKSLKEGLLYDMGEQYIRLLHYISLKSENSYGFVALDRDQIIGAAICSKNINDLYRKMIFHPKFLFGLAKRIFRLKKLYSTFGKEPIKYEFTFFFIDKAYHNLYVALNLMNLIDKYFSKQGIYTYTLQVKETNKTAIVLYEYFGFKKYSEIGTANSKRVIYIRDNRKK